MLATRTSDTALVLALLGGLLILGGGILDSLFFVSGVGVFGMIAGVAIMAMALALRSSPKYRRELGAGILLLSLVSFFGDSGFYLGALLGVIGGLVAVTSRGSSFAGSPVSVYAPRTSGTSFSLGSTCSRCGKPVPGWTGTCPYCGYPDR